MGSFENAYPNAQNYSYVADRFQITNNDVIKYINNEIKYIDIYRVVTYLYTCSYKAALMRRINAETCACMHMV
jgi:hypothetical protein